MNQRLLDLAEVKARLKKVLAEDGDNPFSIQVDDGIEIGNELDDISKWLEKILKAIKEVLRAEALKRNGGRAGTVNLAAASGAKCRVSIPATKLVIKDKVTPDEIEKLKGVLGGMFPSLFEEITLYKLRKDFAESLLNGPGLDPAVMAVIEMKDETPKVYFKET